jgi:hypothetical protein
MGVLDAESIRSVAAIRIFRCVDAYLSVEHASGALVEELGLLWIVANAHDSELSILG